MDINLNTIQKEIVNYNQPEMLINGVAGSGKTLCLLFNAVRKSQESSGIFFFTYNKTLQKYLKDMISTQDISNIHISTFHKWALDEFKKLYPRIRVIYGKLLKTFLDKAIELSSANYSGRFIKEDKYRDFLLEEIDFINEQYVTSREEYLKMTRVGRGTEIRLSQADRKEVYDIYENFQVEKFKGNFVQFSELAARLLDNIDKVDPDNKIKHIYIDEAQDLSKAQLLLLKNLSQETFYVAADKGQKIYNTSYSWREIGVNILGGRTKILTTSYRTTEQILRLAKCLQSNDAILEDAEFTEAVMDNMKQGPLPKVVKFDKHNQEKTFLSEIKDSNYSENSVGVIVNTWYEGNKYANYLKKAGVPHEFIKQDEGSSLLPGVKITTSYSSKGLEFDHVIYPNFKLEKNISEEDPDSMNKHRRLYYVSFTRARHKLSILVPKESPSRFFDELSSDFYKKN